MAFTPNLSHPNHELELRVIIFNYEVVEWSIHVCTFFLQPFLQY